MAGSAEPDERKSLAPAILPDSPGGTGESVLVEVPKDDVQLAAAKLYGQGLRRRQIVLILVDLLAPVRREGKRDRTREEQESLARSKLRRWEQSDSFRDLVYKHAIVKADMEIPGILKGMSKKARGRVDAARLILEVTGRHNPKGETQAPNITVQIANIPRPE